MTVIDASDADWWRGKCLGRIGFFPSKYVTKLAPNEKPLQVTHNLQISGSSTMQESGNDQQQQNGGGDDDAQCQQSDTSNVLTKLLRDQVILLKVCVVSYCKIQFQLLSDCDTNWRGAERSGHSSQWRQQTGNMSRSIPSRSLEIQFIIRPSHTLVEEEDDEENPRNKYHRFSLFFLPI